ncbi:hypothetical protein NPIL_556901 [Nephila pilipes]|uniref:Uncharacterized protein n=1 Tax=Nephila pilipes TaxID=299642 RepID=A0A8X6TM48_NEPPI|nr:hypothetical protein NPIL_556901 [Nephila pilipes]
MNRILWKCCGKTFRDITKYTDHFLIVHTKNADYKETDAKNSSDHTTLRECAESGSKQIRIPKKSTRKNKCKKDVAIVDSIRKSNDTNRIIETATKNEFKKNITLVGPIRSSTDSNKLFKEPTNIFVKREQDDNILQKSVKRSIESYVKCNAS